MLQSYRFEKLEQNVRLQICDKFADPYIWWQMVENTKFLCEANLWFFYIEGVIIESTRIACHSKIAASNAICHTKTSLLPMLGAGTTPKLLPRTPRPWTLSQPQWRLHPEVGRWFHWLASYNNGLLTPPLCISEFLKICNVNNTVAIGEFFAIALVSATLVVVAFPKQFLVVRWSPPPLTLDPMWQSMTLIWS